MEILVAWSLNGPSKWQQLTHLGWPAQHVLLPPAGVTALHRQPLPHDALTSQLKGKSNLQLHSLHLNRKVQIHDFLF